MVDKMIKPALVITAVFCAAVIAIVFLSGCAYAQSPQLYGADGRYLGSVNSNRFDPNSVANPFGQYGNPFNPNSINNRFGVYGNPYSPYSVRNPYGR